MRKKRVLRFSQLLTQEQNMDTFPSLISFQSEVDDLISLTVHVDQNQDTVWLNLNQMAALFQRDKSVISRHLKKIFEAQELEKSSAVAFFATTAADEKTYTVEYFNLDAILAVGYRVNSKRGAEFRRWASEVLKSFLLKGYTHNKERLFKTGFSDISRSLDLLKQTLLSHGYGDDIGHAALDIIRNYTKSWLLLNAYDENRLEYIQKYPEHDERLNFEFFIQSVQQMKEDLIQKNEASRLFGALRENAFAQILGSIHQTFGGNLLYPSVYERAAHLFYFVIKDHPFVDGNKRIGSFFLLLYLSVYSLDLSHITNESLIALALLVAQSQPSDKEIIIKLVLNLITKD
jgi:prophage maintenance system killer protein